MDKNQSGTHGLGETSAGVAGGFLTGCDAYVIKLDGATGETLWTTQFGSAVGDLANAVAVDGNDGAMVVAGYTCGALPRQSNVGGNVGNRDAYVMKLNGATGASVWTKQFGTLSRDDARAVSIDADDGGTIVVAGFTGGTLSVPQASSDSTADAYVTKLRGDTGATIWTKQYGATAGDSYANAVCVDGADRTVVVAGDTAGSLQGQPVVAGSGGAYVVKLNGTTGEMVWTNQFGASTNSVTSAHASEVAFDHGGDRETVPTVVVAGYVTGGALPGQNQTSLGSTDAYVMKLDGATGVMVWT